MSNSDRLELYQSGLPRESSFFAGMQYVAKTSANGMLRLIERINLETHRIPLNVVPLGGREGINDVFQMFGKARQGFRLLFQTGDSQIDHARFLDAVGISADDRAAYLIGQVFPQPEVIRPNDKFALSVFLGLSTSLRRLGQLDTVNFYTLGITPADTETGLILARSYWQYNLTAENTWTIMGEMEYLVRQAILTPGLLGRYSKFVQAAHFLGANLSLRTA